jgi:hypothetical protein
VLGFTFLHFISIVTLTFALMLSALDFITAFSAIIACMTIWAQGWERRTVARVSGHLNRPSTAKFPIRKIRR